MCWGEGGMRPPFLDEKFGVSPRMSGGRVDREL